MAENFLTRKRYLKQRTKNWLSVVCVLGGIAVYYYPVMGGFWTWLHHQNGSYPYGSVRLPILWEQHDSRGFGSWSRPPHSAFSASSDFLSAFQTQQGDPSLWAKLWGSPDATDIATYPALKDAVAKGMYCGSIKHGQEDQIGIGCRDKNGFTFSYSGAQTDLEAAFTIIWQVSEHPH